MKLLFSALIFGVVTLQAQAASLVMVEQDGCHWCERWNAEISHIYPKTSEGRTAPLTRVHLRNLPDDIAFKSRPVFTPTFVLVEDGAELGRIEGYAGEDFFWFLLNNLMNEHSISTEDSS